MLKNDGGKSSRYVTESGLFILVQLAHMLKVLVILWWRRNKLSIQPQKPHIRRKRSYSNKLAYIVNITSATQTADQPV